MEKAACASTFMPQLRQLTAGRLLLLRKLLRIVVQPPGMALAVGDMKLRGCEEQTCASRPQSDAASDRLRRRVLTPEQSLAAALRWRRDDEAVAAEQAAMWLGAGAGEAGRPHDAMDTDAQAESAEHARPAPQGLKGFHESCGCSAWLSCS